MVNIIPYDKYILQIHSILDQAFKEFGNSIEKITKDEITITNFSRRLGELFEQYGYDVCYATHEKFLVFKNGIFFEGKYEPEYGFDPQDEFSITIWSTKRLLKVLTTRDNHDYDWYIRNWVKEVIKKHYGVEIIVKF